MKSDNLSTPMKIVLLNMYNRHKSNMSTANGRDHWYATLELDGRTNSLIALQRRDLVDYECGYLYPEDEKFNRQIDKWRLNEKGIEMAERLVLENGQKSKSE
jgi:hypothetical protein